MGKALSLGNIKKQDIAGLWPQLHNTILELLSLGEYVRDPTRGNSD